MSERLSLLSAVDPQQLGVQSLLQSLHRGGVNARRRAPPAVPCLRFELGCGSAGTMTCRVEANAWAAVHLPGLVGLDWSSMDPVVLDGLVAVERPLHFADQALHYDHARALPMLTPPAATAVLPAVIANEGEVWIESRSAPLPPGRRSPPLPADLAVPVRLQLGEVLLTPRRLRRLRGGDIVLLGSCAPRAWRGTCPLFDFQLHPDSLTVTTVHSPYQPDPDRAIAALPAESSAQDMTGLDDLPLELGVLLCRLDMRLHELAALQEGSVLALPEHANQRVELVHNGRRIAVGELVQVGDRLGVKLVRVPGSA